MSDWIENRLADAENWVYNGHDIPSDHSHFSILGMGDFPPLSELIRDSRFIYDIAVGHFPDPDRLRTMSHTLNDLHENAHKLSQEYEQSLQTLPSQWTGPQSEAYYTSQTGYASPKPADAMLMNLQSFTNTFSQNATTHLNLAGRMDGMRSSQIEIWACVGGAVVSIGALIAFPPDAEITIPTLSVSVAGGVRVAYIIIDLTPLLNVVKIGLGAAAAFCLVEAAVLEIQSLQMSTAGSYPTDWTLPDGTQLADGLKKIAEGLWDKFKDLLKGLGLTEDQIAKLIAYVAATYCSATAAETLLSSLVDSISNSDPNTQNKVINTIINFTKGIKAATTEVKRLLYVMMNLIVQGYKPIGLDLPYSDVNGAIRDVDVTAIPISGSGQTLYIEVGGSNKGDTNKDITNSLDTSRFEKFKAQIDQLKLYAAGQAPPGTAQCYLEEPSVPQPDPSATSIPVNNPWARFWRAEAYAQSVLGPNNVFIIPSSDNGKGACVVP